MAVAWLRFLSECLILNYRQCPVSVTLEVDVSQHQRWTWPVTCENSLDLFLIWSPGGPTPIGRSPWSLVHIKNVGPHPVWTWAAINKNIQKTAGWTKIFTLISKDRCFGSTNIFQHLHISFFSTREEDGRLERHHWQQPWLVPELCQGMCCWWYHSHSPPLVVMVTYCYLWLWPQDVPVHCWGVHG